MAVLLGGRAAETLVFDETSTGASDDLAKATDIARSMVTRYGMDEKLGMVSLESERSPFLQMPGELATVRRDYSEETAHEVDCAVRDLITTAFERAARPASDPSRHPGGMRGTPARKGDLERRRAAPVLAIF